MCGSYSGVVCDLSDGQLNKLWDNDLPYWKIVGSCVPKKNDVTHVGEAYKLAFYCGEQWIVEGKMDGFNIGQNIGKAAGQSIMWPHVHFIPRRNGDCDKNTNNGLRLSHPKGDHKEYY